MKWQEILSLQQMFWLNEQLEGFDVLSTTVHGSHLYGLNREGSDVDIKVVYAPSFDDLLMGDSIKTHNYKNKELDIEVEIKSLPSFLKSAKSCDTNCMDLLHASEDMQITTCDMWEKLKSHRTGLYAKNMKGIIGYIKTHTHKYSNKIQRFDEMRWLFKLCEDLQINGYTKVSDVCESSELTDAIADKKIKYISVVDLVTDHEQTYLEVCGKKYTQTWDIGLLMTAMEVEIAKYGNRTNTGSDKGMDFKSLSHALRVLYQLKEIISKQTLTFPLIDAPSILEVKLGHMDNEDEVLDLIHNLYEECIQLLEDSELPENVSIDGMLQLMKDYYKEKIK